MEETEIKSENLKHDETVTRKDIIMLLCLAFHNVIIATTHTAPTFYNYTPPFICKGYANLDPCNLENGFNHSYSNLKPGKSCTTGYEFQGLNGEISAVTEWNLVCDKKVYSALSVTWYFIAVAIGALITGVMMDKYGRRFVMYGCIYIQGIFGIALSLTSNSFITFAMIRFIQGLFIQGILTTTYTLVNEVLPAKHRTILTSIIEIFWAVGLIMFGIIAYFLPNWRHLCLAVTVIPLVVPTISMWIIPESASWLESDKMQKEMNQLSTRTTFVRKSQNADIEVPNGVENPYLVGSISLENETNSQQTDATIEESKSSCLSLNEINSPRQLNINENSNDAVINNTNNLENYDETEKLPNSILEKRTAEQSLKILQQTVVENEKKNVENRSVLLQMEQLFSIALLRNRFLLMMLLWFTDSISYYGVTFSIPELTGNLYVNFIMGGFLEIIFFISISFAIYKCGRRCTMSSAFLISGISYLIAGIISKKNMSNWIGFSRTFLVIFGKGCVLGNYMCLLLYTMELFPIQLRGFTLGFFLFCSQTGTFIAPLILLLVQNVPLEQKESNSQNCDFGVDHIWVGFPFVFFASLNILCGISTYMYMPETQNAPLPTTIKEAIQINKQ